MTATLRKDFDEFLFASVGEESDGSPLTLLTVLARLGFDPWEEAANLAQLSPEPAMQRLAMRLEALPNAPAIVTESANIATRLIALLHRAPQRKVAASERPLPRAAEIPSTSVNVAIFWLMGLLCLLIARWALSS